MCSQSPRLLPRLYFSERSESQRERGFHERCTVLSPPSCEARKKPLGFLKHSSSSIGVIIGAIGITSSPLSTQDGGTSDRSLKAATNPSRLPRRLRLIKRYTSSPACLALQILAQASRAGTKALREGCARRHVPNCFPVNNERTCR
jgi:hypothetical protein